MSLIVSSFLMTFNQPDQSNVPFNFRNWAYILKTSVFVIAFSGKRNLVPKLQ